MLYSEEALENMRKASKALLIKNLDGTVYGHFSSITEAAENLKCSPKTIFRSLRTEKKLLKRK